MQQKSKTTKRARQLRAAQTKSEGLLWSLLRSQQLCGLKFRRQHPIGPYYVDFACVSRRVVVELGGAYHDDIQEADLRRQHYLESQGWQVVRFHNDDVLRDAEAVIRAIASKLGVPFRFYRRNDNGSGFMCLRAGQSPTRPLPRPTSPEGR